MYAEPGMNRHPIMRGNSRKYRIKSRYDNSLTWANQTRILAQSFEQLGSVIGGSLINAFKPLVAWLNRAMQSVIAFAQTVVNALGKIFGWTYEIKGGGISNDFEAAGAGAEEMADGTGATKDNLKDMQKYIAAWHEVNNMTTKDDDAGGGKGSGGGGAGGGLGDAAGGQLVRTEGLFEKYKSDIDSLYELGEYIGKVLTDAMNGINWDKVYEGARNFGRGLADFLNGLISPELFGAVGRTIAGSLNVAIYAALAFGERFDWTDFGKSIATGINEFFKMFDFASLAKMINVWANGILDAIIKAIDTIDWGMIGTRIGTFLAEIDFLKIAGKVMKTLWKALNAAFETYEGLFETAPLETALLTLVGVTKLLKVNKIQKFIAALKGGITTAINFGKALMGSQTALEALRTGFPRLTKVIEVAQKAFSNFRFVLSQSGSFMNAFGEGINTIRNNMTNMQKGITTAVAAFAEFMVVKDSVKDIVTGTGNLAVNLLELGAAAGIAGLAMYTALGPAGIAIAAITGLVAALVGVKEAMDDMIDERIGNTIRDTLSKPGGTSIEDLAHKFKSSIEDAGEGFVKINEKSEGLKSVNENIESTWLEINRIKEAMDNGVLSVEKGKEKLDGLFEQLALLTEKKFETIETTLLSAYGEGGAFRDAMEQLGVDTEAAIDAVVQYGYTNAEEAKRISQEMLNVDYGSEKYKELERQLFSLTGEISSFSTAVSDFAYDINSTEVDYSGIVLEDGTLDESALRNYIEDISISLSDYEKNLDNAGKELKLDWEEIYQSPTATEEQKKQAEKNLNFLPEAIQLMKEDGKARAKEVTDMIESDLIQKTIDVIESSKTELENMNPIERAFAGRQDEYVKEAVNRYRTNVLLPVSNQIRESMGELGIEGAGKAYEVSGQIMNGLFTIDETALDMGASLYTTRLNGAYREVVEGAVAGLDERAKELGTITGSYLTDGIAEGAKAGRSIELIKNSASEAIDAYDRSAREAGQINSPSERMKPIGMYLLQGIIEGFTASIGQWTASITTWATETYNLFSSNVTTTITNVTAWFSELPEKIYNAIFPSIERVTIWGGQVFQTFQTNVNNSITGVVNWFCQLPGKIYSSIITFVTQTLPQWKGNIDSFFSSAIPNVINNVVHLFGDMGSRLVPVGEDIIRGLWNGISNLTGWIGEKIGGFCNNLLDKFRDGLDEHSPSKEAFKIGDYFTIGLGNGLASRFSDVYGDVESFTRKISSMQIDVPILDYSMPEPKGFTPQYSEADMGRLKTTLQMEMDEKMAQMAYENRQLRDAVEQNTQILEKILAQGIVLDDNTFTSKYKSASSKFYKQHRYEMGLYPAGR